MLADVLKQYLKAENLDAAGSGSRASTDEGGDKKQRDGERTSAGIIR